jgi:hypothetical protein
VDGNGSGSFQWRPFFLSAEWDETESVYLVRRPPVGLLLSAPDDDNELRSWWNEK